MYDERRCSFLVVRFMGYLTGRWGPDCLEESWVGPREGRLVSCKAGLEARHHCQSCVFLLTEF